ncbi:glycoside hydrolase family 48 protein [Peterkaempfera bronchialis]|uniref:Cellulose 1,4-beta-cellobiosidase n=1 Tax=Peterkaempfera bronchialis TaxID=2126346 RepID=A0A345SZ75_9ACTN|nr:glycoside hydrolase family 48 protein [Peterkaempfera bronchialis]AXI79030.1 cellulose 1,4-beta-cellobiosidase [Peterkaempfera bronchialis]
MPAITTKPPRSRRGRLLTASGTGLALILAGLTTAAGTATPAAAATVQCSVDYSTNDWGSGFTANLTITNRGTAAINGWTLGYSYAGNQTLQSGWNGVWSQSGKAVTVKDAGWNAAIPAGGNTTTSANFNYSGTNAKPTSFTVNGTACNGAHAAPTVTLTSPTAGGTYSAGGNISLAASASAADGATISKVEFYSNTTLIGTATAAPFTFNWANVPAGDYSVYAKAYDSLGASTESAPVGVHVASGPALVAVPDSLSVQQGKTATFQVKLSQAPTANVTATVSRASGNTGLSVTGGASLTFTPSNWNTAQTVTVTADANSTGAATFTVKATGYSSANVTVTELKASTAGTYTARFLDEYNKITAPANGYFSPEGIPYHSVETLIIEAPDQGHETTSEAYSYLIWLQAEYGQVTGDWSKFNAAWTTMEKYMIPTHADQPTNSFYDPSKPATYAPEHDLPEQYPSQLDSGVSVGKDPIAAELKSAYGTDDIYGMHWLQDVDNVYGYGGTPGGTCEGGPTAKGPSYINSYQRGPQESVFETIPQPSCDNFKYGGPNGYLDLFTKDSGYAKQWKYTDAPDADARAIQAAYWADTWAKAQGKGADVAATVAKAGKMGDYLRYSFFDKYFKKIGNCTSPSCAAGTGKDSAHYLLSWYYAWGGATDSSAGWAWRIGDSAAHQGYQNPMAAYALINDTAMAPKSATGKADWTTSLQRQLEFYTWLQSSEGAIAGGATNSVGGAYQAPPAGTPTFYGMSYDPAPVYHDPDSNQWFGFQAWSLERVAEYYYATGDAKAKAILDKWVSWAVANTKINPDGTYQIPSTLKWTGAPATWNATNPASNTNLHVTIQDYTNDVGVTGSYAKLLTYYAAKSGNAAAKTTAKGLLDGMWSNYQDSLGVAVPETRADYNRVTQKYSTSNTNHDGVYVPPGWTGTMPNGDKIDSNATFLSIRSWYKNDPQWSKVQNYLNGGAAPVFTYHRFWAQADIATALAAYGQLFNE